LMVEGLEGRRQTATITPDGKVNVAGQLFDSVSPAAIRALELAGKAVKASNGWYHFRVLRGGSDIGSLLEDRAQYEDRGEEAAEGPDALVLAAVEQLKPVLGLLPEVATKPSKATVSFYIGKLVVGYAHPRKTALPRLRVYVGEQCPDWVTPDPSYTAWG